MKIITLTRRRGKQFSILGDGGRAHEFKYEHTAVKVI